MVADRLARYLDRRGLGRVLDGVRDEVRQHLDRLVPVGLAPGLSPGSTSSDEAAPGLGLEAGHYLGDHCRQVDRGQIDGQLARLDPGHREQVVNEAAQALRGGVDLLQGVPGPRPAPGRRG